MMHFASSDITDRHLMGRDSTHTIGWAFMAFIDCCFGADCVQAVGHHKYHKHHSKFNREG